MSECLFCKITSGSFDTSFLYEDDICCALKDINPKAKTHLLVVPKMHIETIAHLEDGDEKIIGHLVMVARNLADELNLSGYKLQFNVGKDGGQEIFHIHLHLLSNGG